MDEPANQPASEMAQILAVLKEIRDLHRFNDQPLLNAAEVCEWLGLSLRSMSRSESAGTFPAAVESPSGARWRKSEILAWVEKMPARKKKGRRLPIKIRKVSTYQN